LLYYRVLTLARLGVRERTERMSRRRELIAAL
jgi:hypothetical protein